MSTIRWSPTAAQMRNETPGTLVMGSPGSGKACWDEEDIITPSGMKKIKDIKVGDYIYGKNGEETQVLGVYPQGKLQLYKVTLLDGRTIICSEDHLFTVKLKNKWQTITVAEMIDNLDEDLYLENNDTIQFKEQELPIHPYIIGAFLGKDFLTIYSDNLVVPYNLASILSTQLGKEVFALETNNYWSFYYKDTHELVTEDDFNGKILNTIIPDEYKYNSEENRKWLIKGYYDCNGSVTDIEEIYLPGNYKTVINDLSEVLRSFGSMYVTKSDCAIYIDCYNHTKLDLFGVNSAQQNQNYNIIQIDDIQKLDLVDECTCFTVDAEDKQFIAGDTVVTHNTFFMLNVCANQLGIGQKVIVIDPKNDFSKLLNVSNNVDLIDVNDIRPGALNPFTFLDSIDSTRLTTLVEILCGQLEGSDIIAIQPIIKDFIMSYRNSGKYTDLQDLADYLYSRPSESAQKVGTLLKTYEDNKYGPLLFTREANAPLYIDDESSIIISLHGMNLPNHDKNPKDYNAEERFTSAILYLITTKLTEILSKDNKIPTTLVCDEAHILFSNPEMSNTIHKFLTMGRSLNVATMLASQGLSHFPSTISQYISSKFIFKSSMQEATAFLDMFDTSQLSGARAIDKGAVINTISEKLKTGQCYFIDSQQRNGTVQIRSNYDINLLTSNNLKKKRS